MPALIVWFLSIVIGGWLGRLRSCRVQIFRISFSADGNQGKSSTWSPKAKLNQRGHKGTLSDRKATQMKPTIKDRQQLFIFAIYSLPIIGGLIHRFWRGFLALQCFLLGALLPTPLIRLFQPKKLNQNMPSILCKVGLTVRRYYCFKKSVSRAARVESRRSWTVSSIL